MIIASFRYRDCTKAVDWLEKAFGFKSHQVFKDDQGKIIHAELSYGESMIMIGPVADTPFGKFMAEPSKIGGLVTHSLYVIVKDPDAHFETAKAQGAKIIYPPTDKGYGGRDYACHDPEGYLWSFGTYDPR